MPSMMPTPSSAPSCSANRQAPSIAWLLCLICSVAVFLLPALWNGFGIVFFDTGGYISRVLEMKLLPGRSLFYGLFLWLSSFAWWSFFGPVLVQSLFSVWLIHLMLRCHDLSAGPLATAAFCAVLGVSTGISWYTSQLMPDGLVPLVVLALWLLGFRWQRLVPVERAGLAAIALLGIMSHMSCLALAIGLVIVVLVARILVGMRGWFLTVSILPPLAVVAAGLVLMPLLHLALVGKAGYTPGGPAYIFGRLAQDGIAQRWLAEHCPVPGIKLCGLQDRIPYNGDKFLWGEKSAFRLIGEWTGAADAELSFVNKQCLKAYPGMVALTALRAAAQQLIMVKTGDQLGEIHNDTRYVFTHLLLRSAVSFNKAKQQQGRMTQHLFDTLNRVHVPVAHLALLGLVLIAGWGLHARRHDIAGMAVFILLALFGNAFICGALSNPHDRYQSRLVWLAPLVVAMAAACWWQLRAKRRRP